MVLASICDSFASMRALRFILASTSNDQICFASSEHFVNFPLKFTAIPFYLNVRLFY